MTLWNPIWRVTIDGIIYTNYALSNMKIVSGRTNIYEQAQAGYLSLNLINLEQTQVDIQINDSVTIELQDSNTVFIPIFGGTVVDVEITVAETGNVATTQQISIVALGALSRLQKALTNGVLTQDFDGDQIYEILGDLLLNNWSEVPAAVQWQTYDPTTTWANAENVGLGEIDRPGDYELAARSSDRTTVYSLVSALATSGLGYIYEDAQGRISYASSTHRLDYLNANGYVDLSAQDALGSGISIQSRVGDVRNNITLKYGANSNSEKTSQDLDSMALFGTLSQIITTTVKHAVDAQNQADFYISIRAYPAFMFQEITFELTNSNMTNGDRDSLIDVFMGMPVRLSDLPLNMSAGTYLGFVEGWTLNTNYNRVSVSLIMSPLEFSLIAQKWESVNPAEAWNTVSNTLEWQTATIVA
jgi:hypothetical protein